MILQRTMPMINHREICENDSRCTQDVRPKVRVVEDTDYMQFLVELPGVDKKELRLVVNDENVMTVSAERTIDDKKDARVLLDEVRDMSFKRSFIIPNKYETDKIDANFKNGMLTISIPKKETLKPKTINIQ